MGKRWRISAATVTSTPDCRAIDWTQTTNQRNVETACRTNQRGSGRTIKSGCHQYRHQRQLRATRRNEAVAPLACWTGFCCCLYSCPSDFPVLCDSRQVHVDPNGRDFCTRRRAFHHKTLKSSHQALELPSAMTTFLSRLKKYETTI
jgi:hypothetical protein